jgi:hypothetical protein
LQCATIFQNFDAPDALPDMQRIVFALLVAACSGGTTTELQRSDAPTEDASAPAPDAALLDGHPDNPLATGWCNFTLGGRELQLPGYAWMNGSGNLKVECADAQSRADIDVGNATYRGPGRYEFSGRLNAGDVDLVTATHIYRLEDDASACRVDVDEAPNSNLAPPGSQITLRLACQRLVGYPRGDDGRPTKSSDGRADVTGSVRVLVRR